MSDQETTDETQEEPAPHPKNDGTKAYLKAVAAAAGCSQADAGRVAILRLGKFSQAVYDVKEAVRILDIEDAERSHEEDT